MTLFQLKRNFTTLSKHSKCIRFQGQTLHQDHYRKKRTIVVISANVCFIQSIILSKGQHLDIEMGSSTVEYILSVTLPLKYSLHQITWLYFTILQLSNGRSYHDECCNNVFVLTWSISLSLKSLHSIEVTFSVCFRFKNS